MVEFSSPLIDRLTAAVAREHDFVVEYFQGPRVLIALQVWWTVPGKSEEIIPKSAFNLPRNNASAEELEPHCFCSGHGEGVYNYQAFGVNDGDGTFYSIYLYNDETDIVDYGVLKGRGNRTLTDFESLTIVNGEFYGVNNAGHSKIKYRLYRILKDEASGGKVPTETIGITKHNGATVKEIDCLGVGPDGMVYTVSSDRDKVYTIDLETAALTYVMDLPSSNIEGCAFGPSGILYVMNNSGGRSKLGRIYLESELYEEIAEMPWNTQVEGLGWHPDGFLYAGIDNTNNNYPAIAKIRPIDGVVVETLDPSIKLDDVEGLEFDFAAEEESCACDMELEDGASASVNGSLKISDANGDGFSELMEFTGDQFLSGLDPDSDSLFDYIGMDTSCNKPKGKIALSAIELDPEGRNANRFGFTSTTLSGAFMLQILKQNCSYKTLVVADIKTNEEHLFATGNHGSFWLKLINPTVTNSINSSILAALEEQDEAGVLMFSIQIDNPSLQNNIRRGETSIGTYSFTMQPGQNVITGDDGDQSDLPPCPDPSIHEPNMSSYANYNEVLDGMWYFHVSGIDDSGNWGNASHYKVQIDSTAPEAPSLASTTHISQDLSYENDDPEFIYSMSDLSGISGYSFILDTEPGTIPDDNVDSSTPSKNYSDLEPGSYWFHVKGVNGSGLWSEAAHYKVVVTEPRGNSPIPPKGFVLKPLTIFQMGAPEDHPDRFVDEARHWVEVKDFLMMQKEVTNDQYRNCVAAYRESNTACESNADCSENQVCNSEGKCATGCEREPKAGASYHNITKGEHPVAHVSWDDANNYCLANGMRLPTESEWEFAAKGEDNDRYPWGDEWEDNLSNNAHMILEETLPVGQFDGTHTGYGDGSNCTDGRCLYDMAGNVEEWVADYYHNYPDGTTFYKPHPNRAVDDMDECRETCQGESTCINDCESKITRGGSFLSDKRRLRVFYRDLRPSSYRSDMIGFRCAMDWDPDQDVPEEVCDGVDNNGNDQIDEDFTDTDNDDTADCVDLDDDDDEVVDEEDNCPLDANSDQSDPDLDGFGEVCDPDGEILTVTYPGMLRPYDVTVDIDGTIYVAGSTDGPQNNHDYKIGSAHNNKKGAVMSIHRLGERSGQIALADTSPNNTQFEDFRPANISLSPEGYLYVTDQGGSTDDGIWKIVRDPNTNQLGSGEAPLDRNGVIGATQRFFMGDEHQRGIDRTSGNVIDPQGAWIYVTRKNAKEIRRFKLNEDGSVSDEDGSLGQLVFDHNKSTMAPAMDSRGWLYFISSHKLYRQKIIDGAPQAPERISDSKAFKYCMALEFDADDNLYTLRLKGKSNSWPFRGNVSMRTVPAKSGFISFVAKTVLDEAHASNIITQNDETKQQLVYGGPEPIEVIYDDQYLNGPRGFEYDDRTGNLIIADTDDDEVVVISTTQKQLVRAISLHGDYDGLE